MNEKKYMKLKVVIRHDAAMEALKTQGEESPYGDHPMVRGADVTILNAETGEELALVTDVELKFSADSMGQIPRVTFTVLDPAIEVHVDPQGYLEKMEQQKDAMKRMASHGLSGPRSRLIAVDSMPPCGSAQTRKEALKEDLSNAMTQDGLSREQMQKELANYKANHSRHDSTEDEIIREMEEILDELAETFDSNV